MTTTRKEEVRVTVIIPNYNGADFLKDCLDSVMHASTPCDVIVVDDGSTDNSADIVRTQFPKVQLITLHSNTGFAHAVNTGIRAAKTPYVFLLNNDATISAKTLDVLLHVMETGRFFSAQPMMLQKREPDRVDSAGDFYNVLGHAFARGKDKPASDYHKRSLITSACGGAAMYAKEELEAMGGFDEAHFSYLEDVDVGVRARLRGRKSVFVPETEVYHVGSATTGSRHNAFKVRISAANNLYLLYKNLPPVMLFLNLPFLTAGIMTKQAYFLNMGLGADYLRGLLDGLQKIRDNKDKKVRFHWAYLPQYLLFQIELWKNLILRIAEG